MAIECLFLPLSQLPQNDNFYTIFQILRKLMLIKLRHFILFQLLFIISFSNTFGQEYNIVESTNDHIVVNFNFENSYSIIDTLIDGSKYQIIRGSDHIYGIPGNPWVPEYLVHVGIPFNSQPKISVLNRKQSVKRNQFIIPFPENDPLFEKQDVKKINKDIYSKNALYPNAAAEFNESFIFRYAKILPLIISPFQFNPVSRELINNYNITVRVDFNTQQIDAVIPVSDDLTVDVLETTVINTGMAKNFIGKTVSSESSLNEISDWYDPQKNYFKIYLKEKGVYKLDFDYLVSQGVPILSGVATQNLAIYNDGVPIPIDVNDGGDNIFNEGDNISFVGYPPTVTEYGKQNIYNYDNVYWFTYEADSTNFYSEANGYPSNTFGSLTDNYNTKRWENDLIYERLGYAPNDQRDYWFWGAAEARNFIPSRIFVHYLASLDTFANRTGELPQASIRASVHGMTTASCNYGHSAFVSLNGQKIATIQWNGQEEAIFEKDFLFSYYTISPDSIRLYWTTNNKFEIGCDGNVCESEGTDIIRVNWFEFDYWRLNKVENDHYTFKSLPDTSGRFVYYLWKWNANEMKIYVPETGELFSNPLVTNDANLGVYFEDTVATERVEYFCVGENFSLFPDSIVQDITSDLSNVSNAADYIIITHPNFTSVANQLAQFRANNLPGYSSPRIKVVDIMDIYDEYSYGLLDPNAIQKFVKDAFENWQSPAPAYIVLLGDMSWDYRHIYFGSRINFIPSISYHAFTYGQSASDNMIVAVAGDDVTPDLMIGRISCETLEEGEILLQKIMDYPDDTGKEWVQDVLFMASGLDAADENTFGFNDASIDLETNYVLPAGISTSKVFRYPNRPEYQEFQGEGPKIREEFDEGTVLANYYGHGGGGQWDFIFTNDDIFELNNGGRLPFIISVTCYTAHFDNQDVFGEKFNKVPGKGSIAFFGSSGLTYWGIGKLVNSFIFDEIFTDTVYTVGQAILNAKMRTPSTGLYETQVALLSLLGDPALELALPKHPDFIVNSENITIDPEDPLVNDTIKVEVTIRNLGRNFPGDSIVVSLYDEFVNPGSLISEKKVGSFGESLKHTFDWIPETAGLYNLFVQVNIDEPILELDQTDNSASSSFVVYDFGKPNIVKPVDGYFTQDNSVDYLFIDIGELFNRNFSYFIELDTIISIDSPGKITSPVLSPANGVVSWSSSNLDNAEYFWRATIFDDTDTNYSSVRMFSVGEENGSGYLNIRKQLQLLEYDGIDYFDSTESLVMNIDLLPPKPTNAKYLDSVLVEIFPDANGLTTFTTDGTYFYYGHLPFYTQGSSTAIYKVGTGFNGTVKGQSYGKIPNLDLFIKNQIFYHSDGNLYASVEQADQLLRINPGTGDTITIFLADSLLPSYDGLLDNGGYYLMSDGNYVYNLSSGYGAFRNKYIMRTFNPANGWQKVGEDIQFSGSSDPGFCGFIVVNEHLITYESLDEGRLRRHRLSDGVFEEEWVAYLPFKDFYAICYDWIHDYVYFSTFLPLGFSYTPAFHQFAGTYKNADGFISSGEIGPARDWQALQFNFDLTGSTGYYEATLYGRNRNTNSFDVLLTDLNPVTDLSGINSSIYDFLKIEFILGDSLGTQTEPIKFESLKVNYDYLPELHLPKHTFTFSTDTLLQGFPIDMSVAVENLGYTTADSITVSYIMNDADTSFKSVNTTVLADSTNTLSYIIETDNLLRESPVTTNTVTVRAETPLLEYFEFNNLVKNEFYVSRDSVRPEFKITFDGLEILNGDVVSAKPDIMITLEDNSPLPLDTSYFTLIHSYDSKSVPLYFAQTELSYEYSPHPNSKTEIHWTPELPDGEHILEILAKDASGNFFDSTSSRSTFSIFNEFDLLQVYNYPNPFNNDTYFTFELRGAELPDKVNIKVYTIAGRLIWDYEIPKSDMSPGFNKIYWNGKDQDGDDIANGVYLYKVIAKFKDESKSITQKLARVR
jgi:hypothetical protein